MEKIIVTIITATYNAQKLISRCIDSVSEQTTEQVEHIIIDGGSDDGTIALIKKKMLEKKSKITYFKSEPDNSLYDAWNKGLKKVSGDWVLFLGADDYLDSKYTIEKIISYIDSIEGKYDFIYGRVDYVNDSGGKIYEFGVDLEVAYNNIIKKGTMTMPTSHQGILHNAELFMKREFLLNYHYISDAEFFLFFYNKKQKIKYIPIVISKMQTGGLSNNIKTLPEVLIEQLSIQKKFGLPISIFNKLLNNCRIHIKIYFYKLPVGLHKKIVSIYRKILNKRKLW